MEELFYAGRIGKLGVCNVTASQLEGIFEVASVKPMVVQNRFMAVRKWDEAVRSVCSSEGMEYQGYGIFRSAALLKSSREQQLISTLARISHESDRTFGQILLRFAMEMGVRPVVGGRSIQNLKLNLAAGEVKLSEIERDAIYNLGG
jgi:diketogulonate reductase-like aldo/keto reductase